MGNSVDMLLEDKIISARDELLIINVITNQTSQMAQTFLPLVNTNNITHRT